MILSVTVNLKKDSESPPLEAYPMIRRYQEQKISPECVRYTFLPLPGQVCVLFGDIPFNCISINSLSDPLITAKYDKKVASVQKKLTNKTNQYETLDERYKKTKKQLEDKRRKYYLELKSVRSTDKEKFADSKREVKIRKTYGQLLQSDLKTNWNTVWAAF